MKRKKDEQGPFSEGFRFEKDIFDSFIKVDNSLRATNPSSLSSIDDFLEEDFITPIATFMKSPNCEEEKVFLSVESEEFLIDMGEKAIGVLENIIGFLPPKPTELPTSRFKNSRNNAFNFFCEKISKSFEGKESIMLEDLKEMISADLKGLEKKHLLAYIDIHQDCRHGLTLLKEVTRSYEEQLLLLGNGDESELEKKGSSSSSLITKELFDFAKKNLHCGQKFITLYDEISLFLQQQQQQNEKKENENEKEVEKQQQQQQQIDEFLKRITLLIVEDCNNIREFPASLFSLYFLKAEFLFMKKDFELCKFHLLVLLYYLGFKYKYAILLCKCFMMKKDFDEFDLLYRKCVYHLKMTSSSHRLDSFIQEIQQFIRKQKSILTRKGMEWDF